MHKKEFINIHFYLHLIHVSMIPFRASCSSKQKFESSKHSLTYFCYLNLKVHFITDESFAKNLLNPFSINCLVQTFTNKDSNLTINGFDHFHSFRKNELKSSKRSSGGIVCYFRQKFNNAIQVIQSKHDDLLWIRFKKDSF